MLLRTKGNPLKMMILKNISILFLFLNLCFLTFCQEDETYKVMLIKADSSFDFHFSTISKKDISKYLMAKNYYNEASKLKPLENYPISRIAEIDKIIFVTKNDTKINELKADAHYNLINGNYFTALEVLCFTDSILKKANVYDENIKDMRALTNDLLRIENRDSAIFFLSFTLKADSVFNVRSKWISHYNLLILAIENYEDALIIFRNSNYVKMKLYEFINLDPLLFEPSFHRNERTGELVEFQEHERKKVFEMQNKIRNEI